MTAPALSKHILDLSALFDWRTVNDFDRRVTELDELAGMSLMTDRQARKLQEALLLRDLAVATNVQLCRLASDAERFPDAQLKTGDGIIAVEITEVMTLGRRRDAEYRKFALGQGHRLKHVDAREFTRAGENWVKWMLDGIKKKLARYDPKSQFGCY